MILVQIGPHALMSMDSKEQGSLMQTGNTQPRAQGFQASIGQLGLRGSWLCEWGLDVRDRLQVHIHFMGIDFNP